MVGEKRDSPEVDETVDLDSRRQKKKDLCSCCEEKRAGTEAECPVVDVATRALDLNASVHGGSNVNRDGVTRVSSVERQAMECDVDCVKSRGFGFDLNSAYVSSLKSHDPSNHYKDYEHLKSRDESESASSVGPLEEKDPLSVWKQMKQNGFRSSSHGVSMAKPRGRKIKSEVIKKNMEIAKRERVDKFAKIAAPIGLLNGLNPGIINHVRNSKQVHSIIEALVRSEKLERCNPGNKPGCQNKNGTTKEVCERKHKLENDHNSGLKDIGSLNTYEGGRQVRGHAESMNRSVATSSELTRRDGHSCKVEQRTSGGMTCALHFNHDLEDDTLALKLSSSSSTRFASENTSCLCHGDSANVTSETSLSVKAANVASQWLELLNQDIRGRLAALRRSKKRVHGVIDTELPDSISRGLSSSQESGPNTTKSFVNQPDNGTAEAHRTRWGALFQEMQKALLDEERQLESWFNQVKEMQLHCKQGLLKYNATNDLPQMDRFDNNNCRLGKADNLDGDLFVGSAAASINSTCDFL